MRHPTWIAVVVCLGFAVLAEARAPQLELPSFAHLQSKATESVDITLGAAPLGVAGWLLNERDPKSAELKSTLKGLRALSVRHYAFDADFVYSKADIDAVRSQLSGEGWSQVAHVRGREKQEDVDVYLALEKDKITGLVIVVSEPREFTIVNVVGSLDREQVARLRKHFDAESDDESSPEEPSSRL